ncbi:hypothetical protein [Evansella clarkii]|uniref:hypothetical protein n=1 Tax=Evansella clarkii TaxID=79879 RepID=UPI000995E184|nr:hypothetical protein [Evansella clarkii]
MAKLVVTYTPDGKVKNELTYKDEVFSYTMVPDEDGKTGDDKVFEVQVANKFPNEPDEVIEALEELGFADEDDIEECLTTLSNYE